MKRSDFAVMHAQIRAALARQPNTHIGHDRRCNWATRARAQRIVEQIDAGGMSPDTGHAHLVGMLITPDRAIRIIETGTRYMHTGSVWSAPIE